MKLSLSKPRRRRCAGLYSFSISALRGDEWSHSHPMGLLREWDRGSHWMGGCVDPRALLDILENERSIFPTEIRTQERLAPSLVTTITKISHIQNWLCTALETLYYSCCVLCCHWFWDAESFITNKHNLKNKLRAWGQAAGYSVFSYTSPVFIRNVKDWGFIHGHYELAARKKTDSNWQQQFALEQVNLRE